MSDIEVTLDYYTESSCDSFGFIFDTYGSGLDSTSGVSKEIFEYRERQRVNEQRKFRRRRQRNLFHGDQIDLTADSD